MSYLPQGEVAVVSAESASLLFQPAAPQQLLGLGECRPQALQLRARKGLTLAGRLQPPVADVAITLTSGEDFFNRLPKRSFNSGSCGLALLVTTARFGAKPRSVFPADDLKLTQTTTAAGTYSFGPLDASKQYSITAEKESYVFSAPDDQGNIVAHKLAEITVELVDDADNSPLQVRARLMSILLRLILFIQETNSRYKTIITVSKIYPKVSLTYIQFKN